MKKNNFLVERRDFIGRMIEDYESIVWPKELAISKKIFSKHDLEFLNIVEPPFKLKSIAWFLGEKGKKWLTNKQKEYYHIQELQPEPVIHDEPMGEDIPYSKQTTLRKFLDE